MALHQIHKGLDLPIAGAPSQKITAGAPVSRVAFLADDFPGLKPRVRVAVGEAVRRGQLLCDDAGSPGVRHTAPGAGRVESINRGARRTLHSIVIALSEAERTETLGDDALVRFSDPVANPEELARTEAQALLVESGLWTAFRTRPYSKVPDPSTVPAAIFVTATDTNPLAADPELILAAEREDFGLGLRIVAKLTDGNTYLCVHAGSALGRDLDAPVSIEEFDGPHPAGTAGLHIHVLEPVGRSRTVWTIGYQDVLSIGRSIRNGYLDVGRVISIGGPPLTNPRLIRTRVGASVGDLAKEEEIEGSVRWISGSVLSGKAAQGEVFGYMGRYDTQLSVLYEGGRREFLGWLSPGRRKFSVLPAFVSGLSRQEGLDFSTDAHGSRRAILPMGLYERVMPMDILPTFLLQALAVGDTERAEELGCLELDEEDLALCSFVDPSKTDFGPMLRRNLELIEGSG